MPTFTVTGSDDPFLHVALKQGESISCESDAMVMMEDNLDLQGKMQGGLLSALARRLVNDESFFQQHITATRGDGDCLLAPMMPGGIEVLDVGATQYKIADGAYMAASSGVSVTAQPCSPARAASLSARPQAADKSPSAASVRCFRWTCRPKIR